MARQGGQQEVEVNGRRVGVTNLDKVLYPSGFTKGQVIDYYVRVAPVLLPHLRGRPLTLKRYPNGSDQGHFYEKRCPDHRPEWVNTTPVWSSREKGEINFCVCDDLPTLVWVAQLASLELHPSLSLAERIDVPTALAFDLDPGEPATIVECARVGLRLRELFGAFGVECFPKTSGSKGLQVYVPLNGDLSYEVTKPYAQAIAQLLERETPDEVTSKMAKRLRPGKVFVDWSQNSETKTTVSVYSLRAKDSPTVSTPLRWTEVEKLARDGDPDTVVFEAADLLKRVKRAGDLFEPVLELEQELPGLDRLRNA